MASTTKNIELSKSLFFDREKVVAAMDDAAVRALSRIGAFTRRRARTLLKKAPRVNIVTGKRVRGKPGKGVLFRDAVSKPGDPPFIHTGPGFTWLQRTGKNRGKRLPASQLKELIFFNYDPQSRSVVIGPIKFGTNPAADVIEYGGMSKGHFHAARPFMRPALAEALPKAAPAFKGMIR